MNLYSKWIAGAILGASAFMPFGAYADATFNANRTDFRDETIYFAMTTRFYDGDPTNNVCSWDKEDVQISKNDPDWRGDFKGLIDKLDYIKALGFTAIWITPIVQNASGEDYHGYHAMDFSKVDLRYESRKEWGASQDVKFQDLIDAAHAKGIKIILDIVLNHTGNFGEARLNPLFERDQDIRNQASPATCLIPNAERLSSNYFSQDPEAQYKERFKYFKNPEYDKHNYYHHYGTGWNWDLPNRWWGQIAGDCVDLNTENDEVAKYLVECYGKFIEMGVDGFRIDTTGHISRLTFNKQFIPQFIALGEKYKSKRLNGAPFYMYGECCARFGEVIYRNQHNLSSHFYTWKSPESLLSQYDGSQAFWDTQNLPEGHDSPVGPMALCEQEKDFDKNSDNVFMKNGAWHEPDYSEASGYNVIDFPMHYNFNNAGQALNIASQGDHYYNDASFNVVYVDSHDYCPGPNDGTRFNGSTAQWAENLSLMFTFRGIPCIYYGSEVEFKKGKPIDVGGSNNKTPRSESGRAYFGEFLKGEVTASDFGTYTATGNVAQTLNSDLAQHIRRLNQIRMAVPALRKGQYTFDDCSANGGYAFKRAYKDSYALVALNGGATFSNVPAGTYTDLVTGQTYQGGGDITVDAPQSQGQLRVLVKDWKGGKVGEDGKFIYGSSPVSHGGSVDFPDPGTDQYYTSKDAPGPKIAAVNFNPEGGTFKTETLNVTATLSDSAVSGWFEVAGSGRVNLVQGDSKSFTIGQNMNYGETVTVNWSATDIDNNTKTGSVSYKKIDPNAAITIYVKAASAPNIYLWGDDENGNNVEPAGAWSGSKMTETANVEGTTYFTWTVDGLESVNMILIGNGQTPDITGITSDVFYEYDGGSNATKLDIHVTPSNDAKVTFSPNGGTFMGETVTVTATANSNSVSAWYKIGNGNQNNFTGTTTFTLGEGMADGESVSVTWGAKNKEGVEKTGNVTFTKTLNSGPVGDFIVYYDNSYTNWGTVKIHYWGGESATSWPGVEMIPVVGAEKIYYFALPKNTTGVIFNNGNGDQTNNIENEKLINRHLYKGTGNRNWEDKGIYQTSGINGVEFDSDSAPVEIFNLQGVKVDNPGPGIYIVVKGKKRNKIVIR